MEKARPKAKIESEAKQSIIISKEECACGPCRGKRAANKPYGMRTEKIAAVLAPEQSALEGIRDRLGEWVERTRSARLPYCAAPNYLELGLIELDKAAELFVTAMRCCTSIPYKPSDVPMPPGTVRKSPCEWKKSSTVEPAAKEAKEEARK
jgi:hypothetical protein